jgi:hypothetical protein
VHPLRGREDGIWRVIIRCVNFLNVCTHCCVLMAVHFSKNSTNKFSSLYQKTLIMTWHTRLHRAIRRGDDWRCHYIILCWNLKPA